MKWAWQLKNWPQFEYDYLNPKSAVEIYYEKI
jgi:hypothetical protein